MTAKFTQTQGGTPELHLDWEFGKNEKVYLKFTDYRYGNEYYGDSLFLSPYTGITFSLPAKEQAETSIVIEYGKKGGTPIKSAGIILPDDYSKLPFSEGSAEWEEIDAFKFANYRHHPWESVNGMLQAYQTNCFTRSSVTVAYQHNIVANTLSVRIYNSSEYQESVKVSSNYGDGDEKSFRVVPGFYHRFNVIDSPTHGDLRNFYFDTGVTEVLYNGVEYKGRGIYSIPLNE